MALARSRSRVYEGSDRGSGPDKGETVEEEKHRLRSTPKGGPGTKYVAPHELKQTDEGRRPVDLKSVAEHKDPADRKAVDERRRSIDYKSYWSIED